MNQPPVPSLPSAASGFNPASATKQCPSCAETIKLEARVCRFCSHPFSEQEVQAQIAEAHRQWSESHKRITLYSAPHFMVTSEAVLDGSRAIPIAAIQPLQTITETANGRYEIQLFDEAGNVLHSISANRASLPDLQAIAQAVNNAINYQRGLPPGMQPIQVVALNKTSGMGWCAWVLIIAFAIVVAVVVMSLF